MKLKRIVIISGSPGSGKSSVSRLLAENSTHERAVHMHTDDFYGYIRKGYIPPWLPKADEQNTVIIESFATSVASLASGGYEVFVDGVIGPWFLDPWLKLAYDGFDVRYVILRPSQQTVISRAKEREKGVVSIDIDAVKQMWHAFSDLGEYRSHAIDTTNQKLDETVVSIQKLLNENAMTII